MQDDSGAMDRAHVVYYLCRNGKVEPPHMIDVAHSPQGLRLRDVKQRLTALRGSRMPVMYAWSFKRIYKNASIWQDVSTDDFILPISSGEYVLKGSEIVEAGKAPKGHAAKQAPEALQRKFWGAESWLTSLDGKQRMDQNPLFLTYQKDYHEQAKSSTAKAEDADEAAENCEVSTSNWDRSAASRDSNAGEVKLYTIKAPAVCDHGCDAATQTDELRRRKQQAHLEEVNAALPKLKPPLPENAVGKSASPPGVKKHAKFRRASSQDKEGELNAKGTKNAWVFFHVLSYCGGLDTKAQQGVASREWKDGEPSSFSDTSRDTLHSRSSDSLQSSDASEEAAGTHKISAFVDVKEMLVTARTSPSRKSISSSTKNFSFLSRQYGRLSKSDTYSSRNVKYDIHNGQQVPGGPAHDREQQGAFKLELNCYRTE